MDKTFGLMMAELAGWCVLGLLVFSPVWLFLVVAAALGLCA